MAERILIVRLGAMGDIVHALHAVACLRQARPEAVLGWIVEDRWADLLAARDAREGPRGEGKPLVDELHIVDTHAWRRAPASAATLTGLRGALGAVRAARYDCALDLQGAIKSAVLTRASGAPLRVGFREPRERGASLMYTRTVMPHGGHIIEQELAVVKALAPEVNGTACGRVSLPVDPAAEAWCDRLQVNGLGDFAILNPGAGWGAKQWPAERYAKVARVLAERGIVSVVNHGPAEEKVAHEVAALSGGSAEPLACSVAQLIALTRRARLLVGGDTGPLHLAAALGVPVVALFGPTDPARNGPYGAIGKVLRSSTSVTSYKHTPELDPGLLSITADQVSGAALEVLERALG